LGERRPRMAEARGSSPLGSTLSRAGERATRDEGYGKAKALGLLASSAHEAERAASPYRDVGTACAG
jgi:hypothetical protein